MGESGAFLEAERVRKTGETDRKSVNPSPKIDMLIRPVAEDNKQQKELRPIEEETEREREEDGGDEREEDGGDEREEDGGDERENRVEPDTLEDGGLGQGTEAEGEEARESNGLGKTIKVSREEREEHERTHTPFREWCKFCVRGRATNAAHKKNRDTDDEKSNRVPRISLDYFYQVEETKKPRAIQFWWC